MYLYIYKRYYVSRLGIFHHSPCNKTVTKWEAFLDVMGVVHTGLTSDLSDPNSTVLQEEEGGFLVILFCRNDTGVPVVK